MSTPGHPTSNGSKWNQYLIGVLTAVGVGFIAFTLVSMHGWLFGPVGPWWTCVPCPWYRKLFILSPLILGSVLLLLAGMLHRRR